jgi:regulator of RNase E activity RraA
VNELISRLSKLDCCAVSDALDKLALRGAVTGITHQSTDRRIAGRVLTVKLGLNDGRPPATKHISTTAIESAQPGDIIVVEQRTGVDAAAWGGILSLGAKLRGVAGAICDGFARDADDSRRLDFPVFARGRTCRTARGRLIQLSTGEPVTIGDVSVFQGDYVIADASAVVFVAQSEIERVLDTAEMIAQREKLMEEALHTGKPISEVMGTNYESMLRKETSR